MLEDHSFFIFFQCYNIVLSISIHTTPPNHSPAEVVMHSAISLRTTTLVLRLRQKKKKEWCSDSDPKKRTAHHSGAQTQTPKKKTTLLRYNYIVLTVMLISIHLTPPRSTPPTPSTQMDTMHIENFQSS